MMVFVMPPHVGYADPAHEPGEGGRGFGADDGLDLVLAGHDHSYQRSLLLHGQTGESKELDARVHVKLAGDGRTTPIMKKAEKDSGVMYIVSGTGGGSRMKSEFTHPAMITFETDKGPK